MRSNSSTALIALSRSTGAAPGVAWLLTLSTAVALRCGDLSRASADCAEALSLAPHTAGPFAVAYAAGHAALLSFYQGRYDDALTLAAQSIATGDAMGSPVCAVIARVAVALTEHRENPSARVDALDAVWTALVTDGLQSPGYFFVAGSLLDACVDAGDRERADVVTATIEAFPAVNVGPYTRALIARTRAIFSGAASDFERALALHGAIDDRLEEARTRLAYADLLRRKRQRTAARREIDVALATLRSIGATHFVTIAKTRLAALDERRHITVAPAVTLSPQEYRVATEVAAGLSNREIAARLFLSVKSVEWHLTRIYRKLGVTSRAKLVAYINREGLPPVSPE